MGGAGTVRGSDRSTVTADAVRKFLDGLIYIWRETLMQVSITNGLRLPRFKSSVMITSIGQVFVVVRLSGRFSQYINWYTLTFDRPA